MSSKVRTELVDSFQTESGKRVIQLVYLRGVGIQKPWRIDVYIRRSTYPRLSAQLVLLSTSEYITEEMARYDFEMRRPKMHEEFGEVPMQRGKRVVQEMLTEKLGPRK